MNLVLGALDCQLSEPRILHAWQHPPQGKLPRHAYGPPTDHSTLPRYRSACASALRESSCRLSSSETSQEEKKRGGLVKKHNFKQIGAWFTNQSWTRSKGQVSNLKITRLWHILVLFQEDFKEECSWMNREGKNEKGRLPVLTANGLTIREMINNVSICLCTLPLPVTIGNGLICQMIYDVSPVCVLSFAHCQTWFYQFTISKFSYRDPNFLHQKLLCQQKVLYQRLESCWFKISTYMATGPVFKF